MARYREELDGVTSAAELVRRLRALFAEDLAEGHVVAVQELVVGAAPPHASARRSSNGCGRG